MSDNGKPLHEPAGDGETNSSLGGSDSPSHTERAQSPVLGTAPSQEAEDGVRLMPAGLPTDKSGLLKRWAHGRPGIWAVAAVACVVAGTVGSLLAAQSVARKNAAETRRTFHLTSGAITSTLKVAIKHEEDLAIAASAYFAGDPKASAAAFDRWARWTHALGRYPELQRLDFIALRSTPGSSTAKPLVAGTALRSSGVLPSPTTAGAIPAVAVARPPVYYCVTVAEVVRSPAKRRPTTLGHCALTPARRSSRASGLSSYASVSSGLRSRLEIEVPVYEGGTPPPTLTGRKEAFVGWVRELLAPGVVLQQALAGHPGSAVRLRRRNGSSNVVLTAGTPQPGAQSVARNLHDGWTVRTYGPPASAGVLNDGQALVLLIAGIALSVLLGLLVFLLGTGRAQRRAPKTREVPHEDLYDLVTGLPNRALMLDRAERMLARAGRQPELLVGALFVSIDWFSDVNAKLGQTAGDQLLRIVADRLQTVVRAHDSVGRVGGDEFVILAESAARGVRLDSLARRVIEALHKPVELDGFGPSFALTASIGVAFGRYEHPDDLWRDAQMAMHAAVAAGRDRYTLFNANMRSVIEGRGVLEAELNTALAEKQLFLLYEPIYDLGTRQVVGLEALIRWRHPTEGVLSPADFIPLAEQTELIVPVGRWMLEEACGRAAAWNVAGRRIGISVKVSATQLNRDGFVTDVRRALQLSGLEPSMLTLEVAETTVMHDHAAATERLERIKDLDVRIALDDVGSAYAHHGDLQQMPLDFLKVNTTSLAASDDEDYRSWLFGAILNVGRELSLTVIAKGIDTYEQMDSGQGDGLHDGSGILRGRPRSADRVEDLFERVHAMLTVPVCSDLNVNAPGDEQRSGLPGAAPRSPGEITGVRGIDQLRQSPFPANGRYWARNRERGLGSGTGARVYWPELLSDLLRFAHVGTPSGTPAAMGLPRRSHR